MSTTAKAIVIAKELLDRLNVRPAIEALGVTLSFASDQNPLLTIGTLSTTDAGAIVKVEPADWPLAQDVFGNTAIAYSPHSIHILKEASPACGLTTSQLLELLAQVAAMGTEVRVYESSSGSGVVLADIDDAAKLVDTYQPDAYHPLVSNQ